jgi:hypothetical protein
VVACRGVRGTMFNKARIPTFTLAVIFGARKNHHILLYLARPQKNSFKGVFIRVLVSLRYPTYIRSTKSETPLWGIIFDMLVRCQPWHQAVLAPTITKRIYAIPTPWAMMCVLGFWYHSLRSTSSWLRNRGVKKCYLGLECALIDVCVGGVY